MSSARVAECFQVLQLIRQTVDSRRESIAAAMKDTAGARRLVDELRAACFGERADRPVDLHAVIQTITTSVTELHAICHLLISEREALALALERIGRDLANVNLVFRVNNTIARPDPVDPEEYEA
jgi:hypothetical protein